MDREIAEASNAAPIEKHKAPRPIVGGRPNVSAILPATRQSNTAGIRTEDITSPCKDGANFPKLDSNDGIVVTGPIVDVSRPFSRPPRETVREARR